MVCICALAGNTGHMHALPEETYLYLLAKPNTVKQAAQRPTSAGPQLAGVMAAHCHAQHVADLM